MTKILKNKKMLAIIVVSLAFVTNAVFLFALYYLQTFSKLSKSIFIIINIVTLLLLLCVNFLSFLQLKNTKRNYFYLIISVIVVSLLLGSVVTFFGSRLNKTINDVVDNGDKVTELVDLSVIVDQKTNSSIKSIDDLSNKKIGVLNQSLSSEIYQTSNELFEEENVSVQFVEYLGYQEIILGVLKGEVDAGIVPMNYKYMFSSDGEEDYMENLETIFTYEKDVVFDNLISKDIDVANEPFNVLLIGMDEQHSDVVMLATFNPIALEITYTSIPRDSYVPICGNAAQKLAHSRNYGRACTIKTVEDLLDINVDYYFETNFKGVVDMVNAIGGIPIDSPITFVGQTSSYDRGTKTVKIFQGLHLLNGEQALAFARERYAFEGGDFQRQMNQQQVITSFLSELVRVRDPNKALKVLDAAGDNVRTNIPVDTMLDLFNVVLAKIDRSYQKGFDAIEIKSTRLTGYGSSQYDESLELMLWIYKLYNGSIAENRAFILSNLDLKNQTIKAPEGIKWSVNWEYNAPILYNEYFNEKEVHDPLPDLVGTWIGENISDLRAWANARGITVSVVEVKEGQDGFDANLGNGYILSQNVPSGRLAKKINNITVSMISMLPKVPDFTEMTVESIKNINWSNDYGFTVTIKQMKSHDANGNANSNYVSGKVGQVASQSIPSGTEINGSFGNVDVYIYDYPYVTTSLPNANSGINNIITWANNNLINGSNAIVYQDAIITNDINKDGTVYSVSAITNGEPFVKTNGKISVTLYKYQEEQSVTIPNFVGQDPSVLINWFGQYGLTPTGSIGADCQPGAPSTVLSYSGLGGVSSIKPSQLAGKNITYVACKVVNLKPDPTPDPTPDTTPDPTPTDDSNNNG